jgi:hypothetical protein
MLKARSIFALPSSFSILVAGALVSGCGGASVSSICDEAFECGSLTKVEYDECIADGERTQAEAEKAGCSAEFQSAVECGANKGTCTNGQFSAQGVCDAEWGEFQACTNSAGSAD